jgi:hypothetical protein
MFTSQTSIDLTAKAEIMDTFGSCAAIRRQPVAGIPSAVRPA